MKTAFNKAVLIPLGSMLLVSQKASASIGSTFEEFIGKEFSNFEGLYIMAGVIISSLVVYVLFNHFGPEEKKPVRHGISPVRERHRHHHHQRVIRKTS
jgi:hypothetical protein